MDRGYGSITIAGITDGAAAYTLNISQAAILRHYDKTYTPSSITLTGLYQWGSGDVEEYDTYFRIEAYDGTNWFDVYRSSQPENQATYTFRTGDMTIFTNYDGDILTNSRSVGFEFGYSYNMITAYRVTMYKVDDTSITLDSKIIPVVENGISIDTINNYYQITNNSSTAPAELWTEEDAHGWIQNPISPPKPTSANRYLWFYQETVYADDEKQSARTNPIVIAVYDRAVTSIIDYYYLADANQTPTGDEVSGWRTDVPAYVSGKVYWEMTIVTYLDSLGNTITEKTTPVESKALNKAITQSAEAQRIAQETNDIASAVNQHFWWDDNGAHTSVQEKDDYDESPSGANMLSNSYGIQLRNGTTVLAQFSPSGNMFGQISQNHSIYDTNGAYWYRPNEEDHYMSIVDGTLADSSGLNSWNMESGEISFGGNDAYLVIYDSDNDGEADSLVIGGANVRLGESRTLASLLNTISKAKTEIEIMYGKCDYPDDGNEAHRPSEWYSTSPQWEPNKYIWQRTKVTTDDNNVTYTYACIQGAAGTNTAIVYMYKRSATALTMSDTPTSNLTYTFSTASISGSTNGWTRLPPTGTDPCYVISALAIAKTTTCTIRGSDDANGSDWSAPRLFVKDGYNTATITLYKRSATQPVAITDTPTYTFATGTLSTIPTGWSTTVPESDGNPCWITTATVVGRESSTTVNTWTVVRKLAEDGTFYNLILSQGVISLTALGEFNTPSLVASATIKHGDNPPLPQSLRFSIDMTDGTDWYRVYTSSSDESTVTYAFPTSQGDPTEALVITDNSGNVLRTYDGSTLVSWYRDSAVVMYRVSIYKFDDPYTILDQKTVPIVMDGQKGEAVTGLALKLNMSDIETVSNRMCYIHGYNLYNEDDDVDGWVLWNGEKVTIPHGYSGWNSSPQASAPFNQQLYVIYRISGNSGTFYNVWLDSTSNTWKGMSYTNSVPGSVSAYTWDEANDIILGMFVMPSSGPITNAQLFSPPKKYSELTEVASQTANSAQRRLESRYGVCNTAIDQATKVVVLDRFESYVGATVTVKFTYGNNADNPVLRINDINGNIIVSMPIYAKGTSMVSKYFWTANSTLTFVHNGTQWETRVSDQQETFLSLTNGGTTQGIYLGRGTKTATQEDPESYTEDTTKLYINGEYIRANTIEADKLNVTELAAIGATIGGFSITNDRIMSGSTIGSDDSVYLSRYNLSSAATIAGQSRTDWRLGIGSKFGVTSDGTIHIAGSGLNIYDGSGVSIANFGGTGITFNNSIPFTIGNPSGSYIKWINTGTTANPNWKIQIAADSIQMGGVDVAGGKWYTGTGITGTSTTATVFNNSGVSYAYVGDMYLNTSTNYVYRCTVKGSADTAKWVYESDIEGVDGRGISSIDLTSTSGKTKTYTITYTDGTTSTYTVEDGEDVTSQYMYFDPTNGLRVYSGSKNDSTYNTSYTQINSSGIDLVASNVTLAHFGYSTTGTTTGTTDTNPYYSLGIRGYSANTFSTSNTYGVGDTVKYGNYYYVCDTAINTAGSWNSSNWTSLGSSSITPGAYSLITGETCTARAGSLASGYLSYAYGYHSNAIGYQVTSYGDSSHAEGENTVAIGEESHTEGFRTVAKGRWNHAEGYRTIANYDSAHAEGEYTIAYYAAHAEGSSSEATGNVSHAEGVSCRATGDYSHAQNYVTTAQRAYQTTIGKYNKLDTEGSNTSSQGKYAFIIGNGTGTSDSARSNALTVDWSGNIEVAGAIKNMSGTTLLSNAGNAVSANYATSAGSADSATSANYATSAGSATYATSAGTASSAGSATTATTAYNIRLSSSTTLTNQNIPVWGCVTTNGTDVQLYFQAPTGATSISSVTTLEDYVRTTAGRYLCGSNSGGNLKTYYQNSKVSFFPGSIVRLILTDSTGWGLTNNTPLAGEIKITATFS